MGSIFISIDTNEIHHNSKLFSAIFNRKINEIVNRSDVKEELLEVVARYADPYVPYKTGALSKNYRILSEGIHYMQPYAEYQYYGAHYNHPADGPHPLARHRWVDYAMSQHHKEMSKEWTAILTKHLMTWWK